MFTLVRLQPAGGEQVLSEYVFDTGREADEYARTLSVLYGVKHQPRLMKDLPDWRPREALDMMGRPPFPDGWDLEPIKDHFARVDEHFEEVAISFIKDNRDGYSRQRTHLKIGRYLDRFYPYLSDADKRRLTALIDPPAEVLFAWTRQEIENVYVNGPDSCMSHEMRDEWRHLQCHPVHAYAAGDLAIAHIKNRQGNISARAVCWPKKRVFGRIYGDGDRLGMALRDLGYAQQETFIGARIAKITPKSKRACPDDLPRQSCFILPYFDNIFALEDKGEYFLSIGEAGHPKDARFVMDQGTAGIGVWVRPCPATKRLAPEHKFYDVEGQNERWSFEALNYGLMFKCQGNGKYYPVKERVYIEDIYQQWSREYFKDHGFICAISNLPFRNESKTIDRRGRAVSTQYYEDELSKRQTSQKSIYGIDTKTYQYASVSIDDTWRLLGAHTLTVTAPDVRREERFSLASPQPETPQTPRERQNAHWRGLARELPGPTREPTPRRR